MSSFLLSVLASAVVVALVYLGYWLSFRHCSEGRAYAECWWLPAWNCFRLVIRNMHDRTNLTSVRYRSWVVSIVPAKPGSSVKTIVERQLSSGERLVVYAGRDLPVACFRMEERKEGLVLVHTDKCGKEIEEIKIDEQVEGIFVEYAARIQSWFLFKHEIIRMFAVPQYLEVEGTRRNLFREYFLPMQAGQETLVKTVFQAAHEVAVSI